MWPKFITEEKTGIRHKVISWYVDIETGKVDTRVVLTACLLRVALGGRGHKNPKKCEYE